MGAKIILFLHTHKLFAIILRTHWIIQGIYKAYNANNNEPIKKNNTGIHKREISGFKIPIIGIIITNAITPARL